jgi:hypothetical protein
MSNLLLNVVQYRYSKRARATPLTAYLARLAAFSLGTVALAGAAHAGCTVPFTITVPAGTVLPGNSHIECNGPWFRESNCKPIQAGETKVQFYCADQNLFSIWGTWGCEVAQGCDVNSPVVAQSRFCIESTGSSELDVTFDGANLSQNANDACDQAATPGFLGHAGGSAGARDRDVFDFAGQAGETVKVTLDRDGTTGSTGDLATLDVTTKGGTPLATRTGKLPLRLQVTLADAGVAVAVRAADGKGGEPFTGGYVLAVKPISGKVGNRLLRPRQNVEN